METRLGQSVSTLLIVLDVCGCLSVLMGCYGLQFVVCSLLPYFCSSEFSFDRGANRASTRILNSKSLNRFAKKSKAGKGEGRPSAAQKLAREKLHLFVSNITCDINPDLTKTEPTPFVGFVSTPSEACQMNVSKLDKLRKKLRVRFRKTKNEDHGSGWPRTKTLKGTYHPNWAQEEIHFMVRTHDDEGLPIDLTGAMLHIAVFDGKGTDEARLIGSFTLNLAHLINKSRERDRKMPQTASSRRLIGESSNKPRLISRFRRRVSKTDDNMIEEPVAIKGVLTQGPSPTLQSVMSGSMFASRVRKDAQAALNAEESGVSDLNIQALSLDEPLVKHGREVGRIQCTIDSWWMKGELAISRSRRFIGK